MENARKYISNISDVVSCGLGSCSNNNIERSLLDTFSTPTIIYPAIDLNTLRDMSVLTYNQRVSDYINMLEIENDLIKQDLINSAYYFEPDCNLRNYLNNNFIVYKFLSGVRVINVGSANGVLQYKIYLNGTDSNSVNWQLNPTFFNLNQTGIYVVEIRDFYDNGEIYKISRIFSMSLLIPSTTV